MSAVFKHELSLHFHSLIAYVFGAALLLFVGLGVTVVNLEYEWATFEYALAQSLFFLAFVFPILTMRTFSEERHQKTDQLLYSLPVSTTEVVLGKFLALLVIFLIPCLIIGFYPLILSKYGEIFMPASYGTLLAFFIMGAAFITIGMFISSLTESQAFACGLGIAALVVNYYLVSLAQTISETTWGSLIAFIVIAIAIAGIVYYFTKNSDISLGVGIVLVAAVGVAFWINNDIFKGLLPALMRHISLFARFTTFVNGVFDLTAIVFFLSVIIFFLFLTVQALEKRRYN
jgi:ABC-2 type transport system permease protein